MNASNTPAETLKATIDLLNYQIKQLRATKRYSVTVNEKKDGSLSAKITQFC